MNATNDHIATATAAIRAARAEAVAEVERCDKLLAAMGAEAAPPRRTRGPWTEEQKAARAAKAAAAKASTGSQDWMRTAGGAEEAAE